MIEVYSRRTLTFATDILRALAGSLSAVYGERVSSGMPWDHFDRAILWEPYGFKFKHYPYKQRDSIGPHIFPSWSWTSVEGKVEFDRRGLHVYRLAHWARPVSDAEAAQKSYRWAPIEIPVRKIDMKSHASLSRDDVEICALAALARLNGCIRGDVPGSLRVDCSKEDYIERLKDRWPNRESSFWQDAFKGYDPYAISDHVHSGLHKQEGRILVHAQRASFELDWDYTENQNERFDPGATSLLIRTSDHRVAGSVAIDERWAEQLRVTGQHTGDFVVLSISREWGNFVGNTAIYGHIPKSTETVSPSKFYGCPCSVSNRKDASTHIIECPQHTDFASPVPFHPRILKRKNNEPDETHITALSKHLADLSYLDVHGQLLHDMLGVPQLNMMMIAPSRKGDEGGKVYERVGIGKIYLKRWAEACPVFETVVLE